MSERLAADAANVTVGRQQRTAGGHLLGAGLVAPDSTHENFTELGLSADPRAMGHGVKHLHVAAPPAGSVAAAAAPSATTTSSSSTSSSSSSGATLRPTMAGSAAQQQAGSAVPAQQRTHQHQQQQQQSAQPTALGERQQEREQQHHHHGSRSAKFSGSNTRDAGRAQLVAPESQQKAWWATAWDRLRHALLGTSEDLFELQPPWIKHPDFGRLNNINALLLGLWPTLSAAIEQQLVLQMAPALLSDAAKTYGAGYVTGLQLTDFSLGKVPPRLDGLKVYQENDDEQLMLEAAAGWGSLAKVTVSATLQLLGHTFTLPLTVQNLQFKALVRLTAQPLLTEPPHIGQVGVTLLEPPHIDFELPLAGVDVMALPLLRGAWRLGTKLAARQFVVYPKGIQLPLVEGSGTRGSPSGVLEVKLVKLKGLRSEDLIGHSDPYVRLRLRQGRELRSRTIHNNNEPVFNQTFSLLVEDPDTQVLQLMVFDEDMGGLKDKVIGVCQMPLKQSAPLQMPRTRVPITLDIHKLMAPGQGAAFQLPIRAAGLPISAGRWLFKNLEGALGSSNQQAATGSSYDTVLDETGWLGPSEQAMGEDRAQKGAHNQGRDVAGLEVPAGPAAAAAGSDEAAGMPRSSHGSSSSSIAAGGAMSAAASPFSTAGTAAAPLQQQSAGFGPAVHRGVKRVVRRPSADDVSDPASVARLLASSDSEESESDYTAIRQAAYSNWQRHQRASGSGTSMQRLSRQSAPLSSAYDDVAGSSRDTGSDGLSSSSNSGSSAAAMGQQAPGQWPAEAAAGEQGQQQDSSNDKDQSLRRQQGAAERGGPQAVAGDQLQPVKRGVAFLELTYTPIRQPDSQPSGAGAAPAPGVQAAAATGRVPVSPTDKGILAVSLVRAKGLTGWSGEADPYVTLTILETAQATGAGGVCGKGVQELHQSRQPYRSSTIFNEDSPRWNEKFDFIDIPASSVLLATVWDQTSWVETATSLKLTTERFRDQVLGRVKVPVMEVASSGRLRNSWPLQGAMMGELDMVLQWIPAELME